jgi:hypothetical protein
MNGRPSAPQRCTSKLTLDGRVIQLFTVNHGHSWEALMNHRIKVASCLAVVLLTAASPRPAWAQAPTVEQLAARIAELEKRVLEFEQRLRALESPQVTARPDNRAVRGNSRDIANWRQLRVGMTMDHVSDLLGQPERVVVTGLTTWYFPNRAHVMFNLQAKVMGWEEPSQ